MLARLRGGMQDHFCRRSEPEAVRDKDLVLDRRQGKWQAVSDLFVFPSRADESDHVSLAFRECRNPGCLAVFRSVVQKQYLVSVVRKFHTDAINGRKMADADSRGKPRRKLTEA